MNFKDLCKERYSVRNYSDKKVEEEKIFAMLDMVRLCPTALNNQPYEIYVATSDDAIEKVKSGSMNIYGATTVFIICKDSNKSWKGFATEEEQTLQDVGIVTTTLMYAAVEVGLGSTYVCAIDANKIKTAFEMPEHLIPESLLLVGYPSIEAKPSPRHSLRREISEFVHRV